MTEPTDDATVPSELDRASQWLAELIRSHFSGESERPGVCVYCG